MIDSSIAATRQLHTALRILDEDDLSAHMLAYNAYCLLRDKFGLGDAFAIIEEKLGLRSIPEFLKHADWYPHAVLKEHSAETAHPYEPENSSMRRRMSLLVAGRSATSPRSRLARPTRASNADRDASSRDFLRHPGVCVEVTSHCSATHT